MRTEENIERDHYFSHDYFKKERLYSFAEQFELVKKYAKNKDEILEVGKGSGFLGNSLKTYFNYSVKTADINPQLDPDIIDNIIEPKLLHEKSFDIVTCFEVLEHMKFSDSQRALQNLCEIARNYVIISIPDMRFFFSLKFLIFGTKIKSISKIVSYKRLTHKDKTFSKDHFWEIGIIKDNQEYSPKFLKEKLFKNKVLLEDYRCLHVPWHHYYVIKVLNRSGEINL